GGGLAERQRQGCGHGAATLAQLDHRAAPQFLEITLGLGLVALVRDFLPCLALLLAVSSRRLLGADREYLDAELGDSGRSQATHGRLLEQLALLRRNVERGARDRL